MISTELRRTSDCQWMGMKAWGIKEAQHKSVGRALQRHQHLQTQYHRILSKLSYLFLSFAFRRYLEFSWPIMQHSSVYEKYKYKKRNKQTKNNQIKATWSTPEQQMNSKTKLRMPQTSKTSFAELLKKKFLYSLPQPVWNTLPCSNCE